MAAEINTTIAENDFVLPELWGKDHFSTLAYLETKLVEGAYKIKFDPHMRQNRRHFRVLAQDEREARRGIPMSPEHGTRLSDGTYLPWHDDWCCVQDMQEAGLFVGHPKPAAWDVGVSLKLTEKGHTVAAALRKHKAEGGTFSNFKMTVEVPA